MRAIVYRTRPAPKAALTQLYGVSKDTSASAPVAPDPGSSITVIPTYLGHVPNVWNYLWNPATDVPAATPADDQSHAPLTVLLAYERVNPALRSIIWNPATDVPAVVAQADTLTSWTPQRLRSTRPSTAYLFAASAQDTNAPTEPETLLSWAPRPLQQPHLLASQTLRTNPAQDAQAPIEPETVPMWRPQLVGRTRPSTAYLFAAGPQDLPPMEIGLWAPKPLWSVRPSTAYLFSSGPRDIGIEVPESWTPSPLRLSAVRAAPLYLFNRTAQDASAAAEPETPPHWQPPLRYAPAWPPIVTFASGREETGPNPPVGEPQALGWQRPITFKPAWAPVVQFSGIKGDTPPPQPPSPNPWAARPLSVPTANLRAASLYYLHGTAEDFGEGPSAQFLVFWQYRTAYEDRVRQFFIHQLQGQPPQDNDESAQPSTMVFWRTRGIQVPKVPLAAFANLYFTELAQDTSAPIQPETTVPWTAQRLGQNAVPKSAFSNLYFSNTAQDFDAPIEPETNPQQWTAQRVGQNAVPRSAFLAYYQNQSATPIIPETTPGWQPRPLWDTPTPISAFLQLYLSHTAQDDNAPVATILQGWRPRPLIPYTLPHYWLYTWEPANAQQSSADDIGRSGWVGTALRTSKVPRGAYLYYRSSTARDDNAPAPPPPPVGHGSEFPQWLRRARLLQYHP